MNVGFLAKGVRTLGRYAVKNAPTILTGLAVCGTITTAIMAGKGAIRAKEIISEHELDPEFQVDEGDIVYYREPTVKEKIHLTWKCYVPAGLMCLSTISCIVGANTVNTKRNAALAAAYSLSEEAAKEFKNKVAETIGERKVNKIEHEIMQDKVNATPVPDDENIFYTTTGEDLMFDKFSGRYFRGSKKGVEDAEIAVNRKLLRDNMASVNDFYDYLGIPPIDIGDCMGWVLYRKGDLQNEGMHIKFYPEFSTKQTPCMAFSFDSKPTFDYGSLFDI